MHDEDRLRLAHMIDAAEVALAFMAGRRREDLNKDRMLLFAVVRAIEVIAEAASQVSDATRAASPEILWKAVVGMRNRLIHGYFDINTEIVWKTVRQEIPNLLTSLRKLMASD